MQRALRSFNDDNLLRVGDHATELPDVPRNRFAQREQTGRLAVVEMRINKRKIFAFDSAPHPIGNTERSGSPTRSAPNDDPTSSSFALTSTTFRGIRGSGRCVATERTRAS